MAEGAIVALDHVVLRVADVDRSLRFYRDLLGLPEEGRARFESGTVPFLSVRAGGALIDLFRDSEYPGQTPREGFMHLCLRYRGDLLALRDRLMAAGVEVVGDATPRPRLGATGTAPSFYVRDPDGHEVELKADESGLSAEGQEQGG